MENKKEYIFLLNEKKYNISFQIESQKIMIEAKEKENDIPFCYRIYLTLEEFKKKINIFDNLEEIKIFLDNILTKKENIKANIDEEEENITLIVDYIFVSLIKNIKLNLSRTILSDKKMIEYLIKQNKILKEKLKSYENKINNIESELITSENQMNLIMSGIKNLNSKKLKLKLIYKATRDGDTPENFHLKCDGISPTISIFKTKDNNIFGGYTDKNWDNKSSDLICNNAFLFSFDKMKIYPGKNGGMIYCSRKHGPWFSYALGAQENNFLKDEQVKQFEITSFKKNWDNIDKEYELNNGKKNYYIKEIEVFHIEFI